MYHIIFVVKYRKAYGCALKHYFWKNKIFWPKGYSSCSIGNVSKDIIVKYIQEQG